jgi:hypothetical protein
MADMDEHHVEHHDVKKVAPKGAVIGKRGRPFTNK